eukprot:CAMPEP_0202965590 /NCGR_PEP_ID=MMETSP1396-20130829/9510_1 /ASSEMBLY_ACC=CAM_ASM_000872 /TAXON_ID= /ORGANISM="Pseudokeronopsis sp., Strain Brazil" /LENGTH=278 /DNA_ID=CAMNT_0049688349 /DNA_START=239 /DNA_END=1075 /DNA_ORIENTATION=-
MSNFAGDVVETEGGTVDLGMLASWSSKGNHEEGSEGKKDSECLFHFYILLSEMDFSGELTEAHKAEMLKHKEYKKEHLVEQYNETAENYEQIYLRVGFNDPQKCAELAFEAISENKETAKILDVGCGTGLVGKYLGEFGVVNIDGIDGSSGMLAKANEKQVYKSLQEFFITTPEAFPEQYTAQYDVVVASGVFAEGHLDNTGFDVIMKACKVGGVHRVRDSCQYLSEYGYQNKINELTEQGQWELVKEIIFERYDKLEEEIGRFKKVDVKAFTYRKIK